MTTQLQNGKERAKCISEKSKKTQQKCDEKLLLG